MMSIFFIRTPHSHQITSYSLCRSIGDAFVNILRCNMPYFSENINGIRHSRVTVTLAYDVTDFVY